MSAFQSGGRATDELLAELEPALVGLTAGAQIVDRDLCVDRRSVADVVLLGAGELYLALVVDGRGEPCVTRALEALALVQRSSAVLARHFGTESVQPAGILLVAVDGWSTRVLERLAGLSSVGLRLFVRRRVESARGVTLSLEELGAHGAPLLAVPAGPPASAGGALSSGASSSRAEEPFESLSEETRNLAIDLSARIARIDPAVESERGTDSIAWFVEGAPLCRLVASAGRLEGHLAGSPIPHRIHSRAAAEVFLDWVLALHLERLESGEDEALDEYELRPSPRQPLLTREEIEAFHGAPPREAQDEPS